MGYVLIQAGSGAFEALSILSRVGGVLDVHVFLIVVKPAQEQYSAIVVVHGGNVGSIWR